MLQSVLLILLAILILALIYFFLRRAITLLINSLVGVILLFLMNWLGLMSWFGKGDIPINLVTILLCAFGGLPGVLVVIVLHLFGIQL
ncbi:MAG: pro-sigmaK processing inhibitor BofA family protein [Methanomicrobiales archaeon]|nr:pro-sigmaK processing inhibitor BofA family protein [Methanomicrobiales archaeon]